MATAVLALVVASRSWATLPDGTCDNLAGTCLRTRQTLGIWCVVAASVLLGAGQAWFALTADRSAYRARAAVSLSVVVVLLLGLVVDPAGHLADRRTGWLS